MMLGKRAGLSPDLLGDLYLTALRPGQGARCT
jgi:hypothetical protein